METLITKGQEKQIQRFMSDVVQDLDLTKSQAQALLGRGKGLKREIMKLMHKFSTPSDYVDQQIDSSETYSSDYSGSKNIEQQVREIATTFNLDSTDALNCCQYLPKLPFGSEGWFAIPNPYKLPGALFGDIRDTHAQYCKTTQFIISKYCEKQRHPFLSVDDECWKYLVPSKFRINERTEYFLKKLARQQRDSDIFIIGAQFGLRHVGKSVLRARATFTNNEFDLDICSTISMLLLHLDRFGPDEHLGLYCAGNDISLIVGDAFDHVCWIGLVYGRLFIKPELSGEYHTRAGSVTEFFPNIKLG